MHQSLAQINSLGIFLQHKIRNDLSNIIINAQLSQELYLHCFLHSKIFCCLFVLLKFLHPTNDNTLQLHPKKYSHLKDFLIASLLQIETQF